MSFAYTAAVVLSFLLLWDGTLHVYEPMLPFGDSGRAAFDISLELTRFAAALDTALLAAAVTFAMKSPKWAGRWGVMESLLCTGILVCSVWSYFGAYRVYAVILEMTQTKSFDPTSGALQAGIVIQYYSLLVGAVLLGFMFVRALERRIGSPEHDRSWSD